MRRAPRLSSILRMCRLASIGIGAVAAGAAVAPPANAQAHYYNLDGGRPGRVEDAEPTALYSLDLDLAPLAVERLYGGTTRYRIEPKASYGVLPFTEVELRLPYVRVV